jgi:hypothetical protein
MQLALSNWHSMQLALGNWHSTQLALSNWHSMQLALSNWHSMQLAQYATQYHVNNPHSSIIRKYNEMNNSDDWVGELRQPHWGGGLDDSGHTLLFVTLH